MKTIDQFNANRNENDTENNRQENSDQQCTTSICFLDPEISEDQV